MSKTAKTTNNKISVDFEKTSFKNFFEGEDKVVEFISWLQAFYYIECLFVEDFESCVKIISARNNEEVIKYSKGIIITPEADEEFCKFIIESIQE